MIKYDVILVVNRNPRKGRTPRQHEWIPKMTAWREERNEVEQRFQNDPRYQILLITVQPLEEQSEVIQADDKRVGGGFRLFWWQSEGKGYNYEVLKC